MKFLELEVVKHSLFNKLNNSFNITYMQSEDSLKSSWMPINIYEFAFKCKEYLLDKGYYIIIYPFKVDLFEKDTNSFIRNFHYPIQNKTIPYDIERIIQACEWVLENEQLYNN